MPRFVSLSLAVRAAYRAAERGSEAKADHPFVRNEIAADAARLKESDATTKRWGLAAEEPKNDDRRVEPGGATR